MEIKNEEFEKILGKEVPLSEKLKAAEDLTNIVFVKSPKMSLEEIEKSLKDKRYVVPFSEVNIENLDEEVTKAKAFEVLMKNKDLEITIKERRYYCELTIQEVLGESISVTISKDDYDILKKAGVKE